MTDLISSIGVGAVVFASTNVDDIVILSTLFADPKMRVREVVIGQYLGIGLLTAASVACARLAVAVPEGAIGLLGIVPLVLGILRLRALVRRTSDDEAPDDDGGSERVGKGNILAVAAVTVANGGDNLGVYIPLFSANPKHVVVYAATFAVLTAVWCALGHALVHNAVLGRRIGRYGRVALPFVLIGLGLSILSRARAFL
ncbi:Cadmium resistance transporter [Minicystis rosea]|nr:Cadmium resistance transporter [Minicystis rosea]